MVNGGLTNYLSYKDMDLNNKTLEELVEYFKTLNKGSDFRDAGNSLEQVAEFNIERFLLA